MTLGAGTLVLMLATSAGLMIAADSRIGFGDGHGGSVYCDNAFNIFEIDGVDHAAFVTTGYITAWNFQGVPILRLCEHVSTHKPEFDIAAIVRGALNHNPRLVARAADDLPAICQQATEKYDAEHPTNFVSLRGRQMYQVAVATYEPVEGIATVQSFAVYMDKDGKISTGDKKIQRLTQDQDWQMPAFGEVSYLTGNVFSGPGLSFLGERHGRFRNGPTTVKDTDPKLAVDFLSELIEAAGETSKIVPAPTGIGGPVDVLLLGNAPKPQRLVEEMSDRGSD